MFFFCIALILSPLEMVLHSYRLLLPSVYLSFQVYKSLFSTIFFVIVIYEYTTGYGQNVGLVRIFLLIVVVVAVLMT